MKEAMTQEHRFGFRTRALHAGGTPDAATGARAVPIYQTTSFVFDDATDAANLFALQKYGNIYSRIGNPTVAALEERLASLEGGIGAVATASGMSAEFITFAALVGAGDHVVASAQLYGGTVTQLDVTLRRFGVETTFVASTDPADYAAAIRPETKVLYVEMIGNPSGEIADIEGLAEVAHAAGIPLVVDSTLATPYLARPLEHGADIVIHSVTKFLGGHGTTLGGVVIEKGTFDWGNGKFPQMTEPVASYGGITLVGQLRRVRLPHQAPHRAAARHRSRAQSAVRVPPAAGRRDAAAADRRAPGQRPDRRTTGSTPTRASRSSPGRVSSSTRTTRGRRSTCRSARGRSSPSASGRRASSPRRRATGGRAPHRRAVIDALQLASHLANIGDARTLVIHPASTTHQQLTPAQLTAAGVPADLIRISVGLEDPDDILWDLDQALTAATGVSR